MGLTIASYNVCQAINQGTFKVSVSGSASLGQSAGDPCNNCGEYLYSNPISTSSVSMSITIPFSSLIYNTQNLWMVVMGKYVTNMGSYDISVEFAFYDVSGNQIGSEVVPLTQNVGATSCGTTAYYANIYCYMVTSPVPNNTNSIVLSVSTTVTVSYTHLTLPTKRIV